MQRKMKKNNLQASTPTLLCDVLPPFKKRKVKHFMYTSSLLGLLYSGASIGHGDITTATLVLGCSSGLWCIGNATTNTNHYCKRLTLYQGCTFLAGSSFLLINTPVTTPLTLATTTFCAGNMFLLHYLFHQEKKRFTLTKKRQQTQRSNRQSN